MAIAQRGSATTAQVGSAGGTASLVLSAPSGLSVGDLMLVMLAWNNGTITAPAGWLSTGIVSGSPAQNATYKAYGYYKIATAADVSAGTFTFTSSVTNNLGGVLVAYSGVDNNNPFMLGGANWQTASAATTSSAMPQLGGSTKGAALVVSMCYAQSTKTVTVATTGSGATQRGAADNALTSGATHVTVNIADQAWATPLSAASGTITQTASTTGTLGGIGQQTLALNPDSAAVFIAATAPQSSPGSASNLTLNSYTNWLAPGATMILVAYGYDGALSPAVAGMTNVLDAFGWGSGTQSRTSVWYLRATGADTAIAIGGSGSKTVASQSGGSLLSIYGGVFFYGSVGSAVSAPIRAVAANGTSADATSLAYPTLTAITSDLGLVALHMSRSGGGATRTTDSRLTQRFDSTSPIFYRILDLNPGPGAGTTPAYTESFSGTISMNHVVMALASANVAPTAPTLVGPANSAYADLATGPTFSWTHSDPNGDAQASYALRRKVGAGAYEYWNAGTSAWQSTEIFNSTATQSVTFAASKWSNGTTYNWSVATGDGAGATGPYATDFTVTGSSSPSASITAPTGTVSTTTQPTVTWTYSDADSNPQVKYRVRVFSAAQYGAGGFDPATSTATADSGLVTSSATSWAITTILDNLGSYRAYVYVEQTGGQNNGWTTYTSFTISLDAPAPPTVAATSDPTLGRVILNVLGFDNLLTANQASIETDASGWGVYTNCTIARSTAQFVNGSASLAVTSVAAGSMRAGTSTYLAASPSAIYSASAAVRAAATAQPARVVIDWYTSADVYISSVVGRSQTDATTGWTTVMASGTSPSNAAKAVLMVEWTSTAAAGEVHYVDTIQFQPGEFNLSPNPTLDANTGHSIIGSSSMTVTVDNTIYRQGTGSLKFTLTNTNAIGRKVNMPASWVPATGETVQWSQWIYSSKQISVQPYWERSNTYTGGPAGATVVVPANTWTKVTGSVTFTAGQAGGTGFGFGFLSATGAAVGDTLNWDEMMIWSGTGTLPAWRDSSWTRGGLSSTGTTAIVEYSDDNGSTWATVRGASALSMVFPDQALTVYDYEARPRSARTYRARVTANV